MLWVFQNKMKIAQCSLEKEYNQCEKNNDE